MSQGSVSSGFSPCSEEGWEWGGGWRSFKDAPHFQKTFGNKWQDLKLKINNDICTKDANGITYVNI